MCGPEEMYPTPVRGQHVAAMTRAAAITTTLTTNTSQRKRAERSVIDDIRSTFDSAIRHTAKGKGRIII